MLKSIRLLLITFFIVALSACTHLQQQNGTAKKSSYTVNGKTYTVSKPKKNYAENGVASWYGRKFHKRRTSSGERYNMYKLTAAHKTLPFATRLRVTNLNNGKNVIVKVNDRGPFVSHRIIDLSYAAAKKIGMVNQGLVKVKVETVDKA